MFDSRIPLRSRSLRITLSVLGVLGVLIAFAGCGDGERPAGESPPPEAAVSDSAAAAATPTTADRTAALVNAVLEAYGGRDALASVEAYRAEGRLEAVASGREGEVVRWFESPNRLRVEIRYPDRGELRITRGPHGWAGADDLHLRPVDGVFLGSMQLQAARLDLPRRLADAIEVLELREPDAEGRAVLRLPLGEGLLLDYHVEPATKRITFMSMHMTGPGGMNFEAELGEFRWVEGVLFPFREVTYAGGARSAVIRYDRVELNPETPALLFAPDGDL